LRHTKKARKNLRLFVIAALMIVAELPDDHLVRDERAIEERGVHPKQRFDVERMICVVAVKAPHVFADEALDPVVDMKDLPRLAHTALEVTEDDAVDCLEGAVEAAERIGLGGGVLIDGVRDERMRRLEERRAASGEEDEGLTTHLPRKRTGPEESCAWIFAVSRELGHGGFEGGVNGRHD